MKPEQRAFWDFFTETEMRRVRRERGEPPPYTVDPVLAYYYFPDIFPKDDVHNRYCLDRVSSIPEEQVWQIHVYRLMNRPATFDAWEAETGKVWPDSTIDGLGRWRDWLIARRRRGERIFTHLHHVRGFDCYVESLQHVVANLGTLTERLRAPLPEAIGVLSQTRNVGKYYAWQISCFLVFVGITVDDPEYVLLGPGAIRGARCVDFAAAPLDTIRALRDVQGEVDQSCFNHPPVTLRDLENALCEYARYTNARGLEVKRSSAETPWWRWY